MRVSFQPFFLRIVYCILILVSVCTDLAGYVICQEAGSGRFYK